MARKRAEMSWKKMMTMMIMMMTIMMMTTTTQQNGLQTDCIPKAEVDHSVPSHRDMELYLSFSDGISLKAGNSIHFSALIFFRKYSVVKHHIVHLISCPN
jgi:hypothetical protein